MNESIKILIVNGQSIYDKNATGITLKSVFSKFDSDAIMEVYYSQDHSEEKHFDDPRSYCLPIRTVPLNYLVRHIMGRKRINSFNQTINGMDLRSEEARHNKKAMLKSFVLGLINYSPVIIHDTRLLNAVDEYNPDIVYTLGADIIPLKLACFFSDRYDIPILIHYMDNWPETKYANSRLLSLFHNKLQKQLRKIRSENKMALVISEKMACEYDVMYYPVKHFAIMNAINTKNEIQKIKKPNGQQDITLAYLGGLHLGRDIQLITIQNAIDQINQTLNGRKARLIIYTTQENKEKFKKNFDKDCVEFHDYVPHEKINEEYSKADILVHIESFDNDLIQFTKYSISTKISEYMFSGKPILLYGPEEIAVYQYVMNNRCGICTNNSDGLIKAIEELIINSQLRDEMGHNGHSTALKNHSSDAAYNIITSVSHGLINGWRKK